MGGKRKYLDIWAVSGLNSGHRRQRVGRRLETCCGKDSSKTRRARKELTLFRRAWCGRDILLRMRRLDYGDF